jgi:hypothetical protein
MSADLVIVHLYPDLLRTYGDRGNILTLMRRAEWRGFSVEVRGITRGERIPERAGLIFLGGGSDRIQSLVAPDLLARTSELRDSMDEGATVLGVCGGYQLLGHSYTGAGGEKIPGLGLLDVETVAGEARIIGRVRAKAKLDGESFELFGFENHGGRTHLGPGATPLATVASGGGNNGKDHTEGAVQNGIVGTYLHGPLLPVNPALADALLTRALAPHTKGEPLAPLAALSEAEALARRRARRLKR